MEEKVVKQRVEVFLTTRSINDFLEENPNYKVRQILIEEGWIYAVLDIVEERTFTYKADLGELR